QGLIHRKQEEWRKSVSVYEELVRRYDPRFYLSAPDPKALASLLEEDRSKGQIPPESVLAYYYHLGQSYQEGARESRGDLKSDFVKRGRAAFTVARAFGYRKTFVESALRELKELEGATIQPASARPKASNSSWHVSMGYLTWEERFDYTDGSGLKSGLEFDAQTSCL